MASTSSDFRTTYVYEPLQSRRHIRLLQVTFSDDEPHDSTSATYSLVQFEIPQGEEALDFEALSYQWGHHGRVSGLHITGADGLVGLTANLTSALPHVIKQLRTKRLWIDQLCINQRDDAEKAVQVGLMSEIYKKAARVIIWLGEEDEYSKLAKQWLEELEKLLPTLKNGHLVTLGSPEYKRDWRQLIVADTFKSPDTSPIWADAILRFWGRKWFTRGWIVQEMLLARELLCLTGDVQFSPQDLDDLFTVPVDDADKALNCTDGFASYRILMTLKTDPFTDTPQPLLFLRIMAAVAQEFVTQELGDRLYGFLGMLDGLDFVPNYKAPVRDNFTRFAATLARQYGSLDFLSMWSSNLDEMLKDTPPELLGLPSWVPSFSWLPLTAPWRLAVGAVRSWRTVIRWNAAGGRKHVHEQTDDDAAPSKVLRVRGHIVDHIDQLSSARIAKYWDTDEAYHNGLVHQIKSDLRGFDAWTHVDMIRFLNIVSCNGNEPRETAEQLLGLAPGLFPEEQRHLHKYAESLGCCLSMGRGRRFMTTQKGRKGLAPFIGSKARAGDVRGSAIVVLHGCIVPMVLQRVDDGEEEDVGEWKVVGDCYVDGLMFGEGVTWEAGEARSFTLV